MIETPTMKIFIDEDGILHHDCSEGSVHDIDSAISNVKLSIDLAKGQKHPVLVDLKGIKYMSRETRNYYSNEETGKFVGKAALVVGDPVSKIMGNVFMRLQKTVFPTRLFTDREKAIEWLKSNEI